MSQDDDETVPPEVVQVVRNVVADQQAVLDTARFIYDEGKALDDKVLDALAVKLQDLIAETFPQISCAGAAYAALVIGATVAVNAVNLMKMEGAPDPDITVDFRRSALMTLFGSCMKSKANPSPETLMAEAKGATKQ